MRRATVILLGLACATALAGWTAMVSAQSDDTTPQKTVSKTDSPPYEIVASGPSTDRVILDRNHGLMWEVKSNDDGIHDWGEVRVWQKAAEYCAQLNGLNDGEGYAGYADWRLPTVQELFSVLDYSTFAPAVPKAFHDPEESSFCRPAMYWTSTVPAADLGRACYVDFFNGSVLQEITYVRMYVRAVRTIRTADENQSFDNGGRAGHE